MGREWYRVYSNVEYQHFEKRLFIILSGSALVNATQVTVMVSLPFLLLGMGIPLAMMGVIEAVGLLTNYVARVPAKIFAEWNGSEAGIASGIIAMGVSMSFLYLTKDLSLIIGAIFLINVSYTLFHYGMKPKLTRFQGHPGDKHPTTYNIFNAAGPFAALVLVALYPGAEIRPVYAGMSILLLFAGVLSMFLLIFNKPQRNTLPLSMRFMELIKRPLIMLDEINRLREKDFLLVLTVIQIVTALSVGSVLVFLPAMAIEDGLTRENIFLMFAFVGLASFLLTYAGRFFRSEMIGRMFFLARPIFLLLSLMILSLGYGQMLFLIGYSITAVWYLLDPGSTHYIESRFQDGDPEKMIYISSFFSRPVLVIAPLMGTLLWIVSPRLVFAIAIFPALIAILLAHLIVNRPEVFRNLRLHRD